MTDIDHIHLHAISEFETEEEAIDALRKLKDIDKSDLFENQLFDIEDSDMPVVHFSGTEEENSIRFSLYDEEALYVSAMFAPSRVGESLEIFHQVEDIWGEIEVQNFHIRYNLEREFEELSVYDIFEGTDETITGVRIDRGTNEYIIQNYQSESVIMVRPGSESTMKDYLSEEKINNSIDDSKDFIEGL